MPHKLIDIQELELIRANIDLDPAQIAQLIQDSSGVIVSLATITRYIKLIRAQQDAASDCALACINNNVTEFIKERTNKYLSMLDINIETTNTILKNRELQIVDKDGNFDIEKYIKVSTLLSNQILAIQKLGSKSPGSDPGAKPTISNTNVIIDINKLFSDVEKERANLNKNKSIDGDYKLIDIETQPKQ